MTRRWVGPALVAVLRHPSLWWTAARLVLALARPGWWHRPPFLPLPSPAYMRFRIETAYGGTGDQPPTAGDVVTYLRWCRRFPG
jgi:hypothetical protein